MLPGTDHPVGAGQLLVRQPAEPGSARDRAVTRGD